MREKINRLAKGIIDTERADLVLRPEKIDETLHVGETASGQLHIADTEGRYLKGLVYSSNPRVCVRESAFGGAYNFLAYEVDTSWLTAGDTIDGAFYLVTSAGEKKIPYHFTMEYGVSGRLLQSLTTAREFAELTLRDQETALRLFEYQDFVDAPFMRDMHARALYDGLRGRPNRPNQLEEFLVALKAKEPVDLEMDESARTYEDLTQARQDELLVRASTWGYVRFDVAADGDFIELSKKSFDSRDFSEGVCHVPFMINLARLHGGKNLGSLTVSTIRGNLSVRVEAQGQDEESGHMARMAREGYGAYLALRLEYEIGVPGGERQLIDRMWQELDGARHRYGETTVGTLLRADLYALEDQKDKALETLESCRADVVTTRLENPVNYCGYQYLLQQLQERQGQTAALLRLVKKYLGEGPRSGFLFALWMKLEPELADSPEKLLAMEAELFSQGNCSPTLYLGALRLYMSSPRLLTRLGCFEEQVLMFGARHRLVSRELALQAARLAMTKKQFGRLQLRLLKLLYEAYPEKEVLTAVCATLIRGDCRKPGDFPWYERALQEGVSLTRLYEYFVYSLPRDYPYLLPKEVLLYFSYERAMDDDLRSVLYTNILKYLKQDSPIYQQYERDMEQYTMEQLLKGRINRRLVVLYQHMVYPEMIDKQAARVLPGILNSYRVRVKTPGIRYVVVCYEEVEGEDAYPVRDGVAYVPLFVERTVLLFQDGYGNRYANIPYRRQPAMEKKDPRLEEQCYEIYPYHPMLRLRECDEIMTAGIGSGADVATLRCAGEDLQLRPLYRKRILSAVIRYYQDSQADEEEQKTGDAAFFLDLDPERLSREERAGVCEALVGWDYIREAWEIVRHYGGWEGMRETRLLKLCTRTILQQLFNEDEKLLSLANLLFSSGKYDSVVLDYLCEHFNGSGKQMYRILSQGVHEHVELYDMPERLLAQQLFTGETDRADQVFDWYAAANGNQVDQLARAYFTMKSAAYFLEDQPTADRVFAYLESMLQSAAHLEKQPTIYLLALARHYAGQQALDEEQSRLCVEMVSVLLSEDRVFAWYRELGRLIPMPESVMDKAAVEYHSSRDAKPELRIRILPDEETYHNEEFRRVYPGVFVMQKVLFEGEILEYQIYEEREGSPALVKEGSVSTEPGQTGSYGRFTSLNEMSLCLAAKEETRLKERMKNYLTDNAVMEALFPVE